ncbi:SpoIIE family protein phosphatase [Streptomyces sp. NPDC003393]
MRHRDGHPVRVVLEAARLEGVGGAEQWILSVTTPAAPDAPRTERSSFQQAMGSSPVAFGVWDTDLRCVWLNSVMAERTGHQWAPKLGRRPWETSTGFDPATVERLLRHVLASGEMVSRTLSNVSPAGDERAFATVVFRFEGPDGAPVGIGAAAVDVDEESARRRLSLLVTAGTRIGTTLDIMTTAQELSDIAVPRLADFATVDLADWVSLGDMPRERPDAAVYGGPAFRRAGMASIRPGVPEAVFAPGEVVYHPPSSPIVAPLRTGESHFEPRLDTSHYWLTEDPARDRAIKRAGMHSAMIVPLKARGVILGVATFARTDNPASFTRDDLLLAEELATRAALSLDDACRYAQQRATALALQRDLLPHDLQRSRFLEVATRYLPADTHERVGGDWYDVLPLAEGRTALVVGDVIGHGVSAAAAMGRMRTAVHALAELDQPPDILLSHLDNVALRLSQEVGQRRDADLPALVATCVYLIHDPATATCTFARAGHPPPLLLAPDGIVAFPDSPVGCAVGWGFDGYASATVPMPGEGLLALYTDGLVEDRSEDIDAGLTRLATCVRQTHGDLDDRCTQIIEAMTCGTRPQDDIALLLARLRPDAASPRA